MEARLGKKLRPHVLGIAARIHSKKNKINDAMKEGALLVTHGPIRHLSPDHCT